MLILLRYDFQHILKKISPFHLAMTMVNYIHTTFLKQVFSTIPLDISSIYSSSMLLKNNTHEPSHLHFE